MAITETEAMATTGITETEAMETTGITETMAMALTTTISSADIVMDSIVDGKMPWPDGRQTRTIQAITEAEILLTGTDLNGAFLRPIVNLTFVVNQAPVRREEKKPAGEIRRAFYFSKNDFD